MKGFLLCLFTLVVKVPFDAINDRLRLLSGGDAAKQVFILGVWAEFKMIDENESLVVGDLIYFQQTANELGSKLS